MEPFLGVFAKHGETPKAFARCPMIHPPERGPAHFLALIGDEQEALAGAGGNSQVNLGLIAAGLCKGAAEAFL
jgi:hypothetical protein